MVKLKTVIILMKGGGYVPIISNEEGAKSIVGIISVALNKEEKWINIKQKEDVWAFLVSEVQGCYCVDYQKPPHEKIADNMKDFLDHGHEGDEWKKGGDDE